MNLKDLQNKTMLMFGKSRAFSSDEFTAKMKFHKIEVVKDYSDDIALIVEGKMMTPYEQNRSDELYEQTRSSDGKRPEFISIDILESELAKHIDADTLLMSLKLSHDKERLKGFIKNSTISDELFFRLLKLYSFGGEDFFENDDNRDVTAALIGRFYENIERNHNIQYATLGLMHLIKQCKSEKLIEAIATLEPLVKSFNRNTKDANYNIITSIAKHSLTPKSVLKMLVKKSNTFIKTLIAVRDDCDEQMQTALFESGDENVLEALSFNANLDKTIAAKLMQNEDYSQKIAKYITLDDELFNILLTECSAELAQNDSLSHKMQETIFTLGDEATNIALASNEHLSEELFTKLLCIKNEKINSAIYTNSATPKEILEEAYKEETNHLSLAGNENTPADIIRELSNSSDEKILKAIAKNSNTPVDILYQLQLDSRFERAVKENEAFGKHIQSENIGWQL